MLVIIHCVFFSCCSSFFPSLPFYIFFRIFFLSLGVLRIICDLNILVPWTPVILSCSLLITSDTFMPFQFRICLCHFQCFHYKLPQFDMAKMSQRNKEMANCHPWLLLQSTCLQTAFVYTSIKRFGHLKQSLRTKPYQSTTWRLWLSLGCSGKENKLHNFVKSIKLMKAV